MNHNEGSVKYRLDHFEGPLDLLLHLVKQNRIDIRDIPIAEITRQFLAVLDTADMHDRDIESCSDFYLMAATLLQIKSALLLPRPADPEEDGERLRRELIDKLIDYQRYKKLSDLLEERLDNDEYRVEREPGSRFSAEGAGEPEPVSALPGDLLAAYQRIRIKLPRIYHMHETFTVQAKNALLNELASRKKPFPFARLLIRSSPLEIVCSFIAVLEAGKRRTVALRQEELYGEILIVPIGRQ